MLFMWLAFYKKYGLDMSRKPPLPRRVEEELVKSLEGLDVEDHVASLGILPHLSEKSNYLIGVLVADGPTSAGRVFAAYSEHHNDALRLYVRFAAGLSAYLSSKPSAGQDDAAWNLAKVADSVEKVLS